MNVLVIVVYLKFIKIAPLLEQIIKAKKLLLVFVGHSSYYLESYNMNGWIASNHNELGAQCTV